jgi:hypothetical protein
VCCHTTSRHWRILTDPEGPSVVSTRVAAHQAVRHVTQPVNGEEKTENAGLTDTQAAEAMQVRTRTVEDAKTVLRRGTPQEVEAVKSGSGSVSDIAREDDADLFELITEYRRVEREYHSRLTGGASQTDDSSGASETGARSIEDALADLLSKYEWRPSPELARMIEQLQAEIAERKRPALRHRDPTVPVENSVDFLWMV